MTNDQVLIVDDEELVLKSIRREQCDDFNIVTALGPIKALEIIEEEGPFAVVISDMRMPEMNGIELLKEIQARNPSTVRMLLTGYAELSTTIEAINKGHIFRFMTKPIDDVDLANAIRDGLKQYDLIESEKNLLEGTLQGCINVLSEVMSLVSPTAFGQAARVRSTFDGIVDRLDVEEKWQLRIAGMLSSLGCVSVPDEILTRKFNGDCLEEDEAEIFDQHPGLGAKLISGIPRMENVAEIILRQNDDQFSKSKDFVGRGIQMLRIATEFAEQENRLDDPTKALSCLLDNCSECDKSILDALTDYVATEKKQSRVKILTDQLEVGMILAEDVRNSHGVLLMSKGQPISTAAIRLLENHFKNAPDGHVTILHNSAAMVSN